MGQVSIDLNGRTYRLECDDGEEDHLLGLAASVGEKIESLKGKFGQIGDDRLMLMAGLMIADELSETRRKLDAITQDKASADEVVQAAREELANRIGAAAERIEALNAVMAENSAADGKGK
jgi:cell division protein ZapA